MHIYYENRGIKALHIFSLFHYISNFTYLLCDLQVNTDVTQSFNDDILAILCYYAKGSKQNVSH